jgi:hypothetical protein
VRTRKTVAILSIPIYRSIDDNIVVILYVVKRGTLLVPGKATMGLISPAFLHLYDKRGTSRKGLDRRGNVGTTQNQCLHFLF